MAQMIESEGNTDLDTLTQIQQIICLDLPWTIYNLVPKHLDELVLNSHTKLTFT